MLNALKDKIQLPTVESEKTATIVWNFLAEQNTTPLFWNSFPFHPHPRGINNKNKAPTDEKLSFGSEILSELYEIYKPDLVVSTQFETNQNATSDFTHTICKAFEVFNSQVVVRHCGVAPLADRYAHA